MLLFFALYVIAQVLGHVLDYNVGPAVFSDNDVGRYCLHLAFNVLVGVVFLYLMMELRRKFREKFSIPGDTCDDCLISWFFSCCALAQMDRHLAINAGSCALSDPGPHPELGTAGGAAGGPSPPLVAAV